MNFKRFVVVVVFEQEQDEEEEGKRKFREIERRFSSLLLFLRRF